MRLYSRTGQAAVTHDGVSYEPAGDGGFDFPEDLGQHLHSFHSSKKPQWETDIERQNRLIAEELERRRDPATLADLVEKLTQQSAAQAVAAREAAPARPAAKKAAGTGTETSGEK